MNIIKSVARRTVRQLGKWRLLSPYRSSILLYRIKLGKWPDVHNPKDMNELVMHLMHETDISSWPLLADKYSVRKFVAEKAGSSLLIPLFQVANTVEEIDFESLPESFVIKTTDGYARTLIVKDKSEQNLIKVRRKLKKWMSERLVGDEPHYLKIKRRLIVEKLLPGENGNPPVDYKFICINGKPSYCEVCSQRSMTHFNVGYILYKLPEWTDTHNVKDEYRAINEVPAPANLKEMISYASLLSEGLPLVRVDLYNIDGKVYFGEMTFSHGAGRSNTFKQEQLNKIRDIFFDKTLSD